METTPGTTQIAIVNCTEMETINATSIALAQDHTHSTTGTFMKLLVLPIVSAFGISGNSLFLVSVFTVPEMKSSLTSFMSNLAIADIMLLLSVLFWGSWDYWNSDVLLDYADSKFGCYAFAITTHLWYYESYGLVTVIAVERYLAVCRPLEHRLVQGKARTIKIITATWLIAVTMAVIRSLTHELLPVCYLWPSEEAFSHLPEQVVFCTQVSSITANLLSLVEYGICVLINCSISGKIILALTKRELGQQDQREKMRYQVTRTLILNNLVFFLCQFPARIPYLDLLLRSLDTDRLLNDTESKVFYSIGVEFLLLNSCINPILYVCCCQKYRDAMKENLRKCCCLCKSNNVEGRGNR